MPNPNTKAEIWISLVYNSEALNSCTNRALIRETIGKALEDAIHEGKLDFSVSISDLQLKLSNYDFQIKVN